MAKVQSTPYTCVRSEPAGTGVSAVTYFLRDTVNTNEFAVAKVVYYRVNGEKDGEIRKNIENEVNKLTGLDHPNIIKLINSLKADPLYFLILEAADAGELADYVLPYEDNSPHPLDSELEVMRIFEQILSALDYLHNTVKIVHGDIKSQNVLLKTIYTEKGNYLDPKLIDFDLAKKVGDDVAFSGTIQFAAPEIVLDKVKKYTGQPDMYSAGCVLYEMLHFGDYIFQKALDGDKPTGRHRYRKKMSVDKGVMEEFRLKDIRQQNGEDLEAVPNRFQSHEEREADHFADSDLENLSDFKKLKPALIKGDYEVRPGISKNMLNILHGCLRSDPDERLTAKKALEMANDFIKNFSETAPRNIFKETLNIHRGMDLADNRFKSQKGAVVRLLERTDRLSLVLPQANNKLRPFLGWIVFAMAVVGGALLGLALLGILRPESPAGNHPNVTRKEVVVSQKDESAQKTTLESSGRI